MSTCPNLSSLLASPAAAASLKIRAACFITLLVSAGSISFAQAPAAAPGTRNPAAVSGGTYAVDPDHTLVVWTIDHLGFSPYTGIVGDVTGTLKIDPRRPNTAKVDVTIPISKVVTASSGLTQHLLRPGKDGSKPDFFGANPPNARFVSTKVVATGQRAKITGNFTLNNVTRPVVLDATFYGAGKAPAALGGKENVGFRATGTILRSQYGLGFMVPVIGDRIKLDISAAFTK
jgi:polyisoprenoid-binding protein YceI